MIAIKHPSTSDAVAEFFSVVGDVHNPVAWIAPYMERLRRESIWTVAELNEIHRAILKWMDDASD